MKGSVVIYKKELSGFFQSPLFYFISFLMTALMSVMFSMTLEKFSFLAANPMLQMGASGQQQNIHYAVFLPHLSMINLMLIFLVPALSMRLLAEEKKLRTYDLLLTSPITSTDIVLGKFLALLTTLLALIGVAMIYPLATRGIAAFPWSPTVIAAFGIFLVSAVYAAMNLFASSLTDNGLIAFVVSVILNLSIWFVGALSESFDGGILKKVFEHISLNTHLSGLIEGTLRTNGLIFFGSLIFLFCFLAERVVESARWRD
ncbi:MAG: ABC transporter permease [Bdellovibrionales bacterium RIFCSPHIGHO2_01_FULL_40_29]|nr:MAG: ABC transporter permease [Bdellovibrionales bacterium RIFCSPHIGHO2_01_FULL_40_29]OFZ33362.1 MAG: ABC transporter permease [Bdellovibrionales bacterium RIFCSPHIGHO2_02_FULL_40_15]